MIVNTLNRVFIHQVNGQDVRLADPNALLSATEIQNFYAGTYPILTTAKVSGPEIKDDEVVYRFQTTLGTKG